MLAHLTDIKVVYADDKGLVSTRLYVAGTMHRILVKGCSLIVMNNIVYSLCMYM